MSSQFRRLCIAVLLVYPYSFVKAQESRSAKNYDTSRSSMQNLQRPDKEITLSWCGHCNYRALFLSAINTVEDLSKDLGIEHYIAIGNGNTESDPTAFPPDVPSERKITADLKSFLGFPSQIMSTPAKDLKPQEARFNLFVINHGGNPNHLKAGEPGSYAMVAGKMQFITEKEIKEFAQKIPDSFELRTVSEACWGANTSKMLLEGRNSQNPGCFAAIADMNWAGVVAPTSDHSWSKAIAEELKQGSLFDASLKAGAQVTLGKLKINKDDVGSNAGLTGSEWVMLEYFRDKYDLQGTSLQLQEDAFNKIPQSIHREQNDDLSPEILTSLHRRSELAKQILGEVVNLPPEITSLQDVTSLVEKETDKLKDQQTKINNIFSANDPEVINAYIFIVQNPSELGSSTYEYFHADYLKHKAVIDRYVEETKEIERLGDDLEKFIGPYTHIGQYHRYFYAKLLKRRNDLEAAFVRMAPKELVEKHLLQRRCELRY